MKSMAWSPASLNRSHRDAINCESDFWNYLPAGHAATWQNRRDWTPIADIANVCFRASNLLEAQVLAPEIAATPRSA
jgi:hypothetical protein